MGIPQAGATEQETCDSFQRLRAATDTLAARYRSVDTLSMGMSGDLEIAVACGTTVVRIGTAIFGERKS